MKNNFNGLFFIKLLNLYLFVLPILLRCIIVLLCIVKCSIQSKLLLASNGMLIVNVLGLFDLTNGTVSLLLPVLGIELGKLILLIIASVSVKVIVWIDGCKYKVQV